MRRGEALRSCYPSGRAMENEWLVTSCNEPQASAAGVDPLRGAGGRPATTFNRRNLLVIFATCDLLVLGADG
jgi:hypothetical protein